jgi:hypothetical protein
MTTKSRFQHSITLTQEEEIIVEALALEGIGITEIFRKGLVHYAPRVSEELKTKLKVIVK